MRAIKQFGYKLIVVLCLVMTFTCFIANTPISYASRVTSSGYYYNGTTTGSYQVERNPLSRLVPALKEILDYILGIQTLGVRIVFVGWTGFLERILTAIIEISVGENIVVDDEFSVSNITDSEDYITAESIFFNRIALFDANVFNFTTEDRYDSLGRELPEGETYEIPEDSLVIIIKEAIAGWYYAFRLISIMIMLLLLIYIGYKLAISSVAKEKALYKRVLTDWVVGFILVFFIHYIILAMFNVNEFLVNNISKLRIGYGLEDRMEVYEYGIAERAETGVTSTDMEISLYDEVRTRAYDAKLTVGTSGMVMYMILVYYAYKFSFLYLKRYLIISVLVMSAPFVAVFYAYNKVKTGKTVVFTNWFKELLFMIMLQSIHALIYVIFFESALAISLSSIGGIIFAFMLLNFMSKAEEVFRKIFDVKGNLTSELAGSKLGDLKNALSTATMGMVGAKAAVGVTKLTARAVTKPIRAFGNYGFGKLMENRAEEIAEHDRIANANKKLTAEERKEKGISDYQTLTYKEKQELAETNRQTMLRLGAFAKSITGKDKNKDRELIKGLMKTFPMRNEKGEEMSEDEYIENFYKNQSKYIEDFNRETKASSVFINEFNKKWDEIMDPFQYVEKNKEGKYVRKKAKFEHEEWGPIAKRFGKKTDSVGLVFAKYMNADYLLNLDKNQRKMLKNMANLYVVQPILGFSGILLGLPFMVEEPALGVAFLAKGISSTSRVVGDFHGAKARNLRNTVISPDGKLYIKGFEGSSMKTIAKGMLATARENYEDILEAEREHNENVVKRVKKHPALFKNLATSLAVGTTTGLSTVATITAVAGLTATPLAVGAVAGVATGTVLTGSLLKSINKEKSASYRELLRVARKSAGKEWEEQLKSTDKMLDYMADKYYEVELETSYMEAVDERIKEVDRRIKNHEDEILAYEADYDEELDEIKPGSKGLTVATERKVIDKAIVEIAKKSGIINLSDLNSNSDFDRVKKSVSDILVEKGLMDKTQKADEIIKDLDSKILAERDNLNKDHAIEDKLVDDSIVELMKEKNLSSADQVTNESIVERFTQKYQKMSGGNTSSGSASAIDSLNGKKPKTNTKSSEAKAIENVLANKKDGLGVNNEDQILPQKNSTQSLIDEAVKRLNANGSEAVLARKSIIRKNGSAMTEKKKEELKDALKRKKVRELDQELIAGSMELAEARKRAKNGEEGDTVEDVLQNISQAKKTDDVIKMLEIQTKIHSDKKERIAVYKKDSNLFNSDGSVNVMAFADGSRRVDERRTGDNPVGKGSSSIDLPKGADKTLLEIISRVNSQKI